MSDSPTSPASSKPAVETSGHKGKYRETPFDVENMPPGIPFIIGNEAAERFSYYGMTAILVTFLTTYLLNSKGELAPMDEHRANEIAHYFMMAVYFFPILGALISDTFWGKYHTILRLSMVYVLGHAAMALVDVPNVTGIDPRWMLFIALLLVAVGAGGIKPCVSSHVGDQFGPRNQYLISRIFSWFYFSINLGSAASTILTPILLDEALFDQSFGEFGVALKSIGIHPGPSLAFGVPGVLMALATFVFWMGRNRFAHIPAGGPAFIKECFDRDGRRAILNLIPLFVLICFFFALFDQSHTSWVLQARDMNRTFFAGSNYEFSVSPAQLQAVNPVLVMIMIPLFSYVIYPIVGRVIALTPLRRIAIGMFVTVPSFALIAIAQEYIDAKQTPHVMWQVWAYVVLTAAEIMVSITVLEFSYTQAPRKMKSFVMGLYLLLAVALGNFAAAMVNKFIADRKDAGATVLEGADYFWFFTGAMFVMAVVFVIWSQFYKGSTYIQGDESAEDAVVQ
jgi:POT family proton-dependent oligopeptide transporter